MNKTYCDICKKEIKHFGNSWHLKLEPRNVGKQSIQLHDICEDCIRKIKELIEK